MGYSRFKHWLVWWMAYVIWALIVNPLFFRQKTTGAERLPQAKDGPYLMFSNHTSLLDPCWTTFKTMRPAHFMTSALLFRVPVLRVVITWFGAFPKQKFTRDDASLAILEDLYRDNRVVVLYPEGRRTWDGRPMPIRRGTGALVKKLNATVVMARNHTGHLLQPRWARYPRWVPIVMEYLPPRTFEDMDAEQVNDWIIETMRVDPDVKLPWRTFGFRLAHGLPDYLWACPACFAPGGPQVHPDDGDDLLCGACGAHWHLTVTCRLEPRGGDAPALTVATAYDRIQEHFGDRPATDPAALESGGVALSCPGGALLELPSDPHAPATELGRGELRLTEAAVEVYTGGQRVHAVPMAEVLGVVVEVGNMVTMRTPEHLYRIDTPGQSTLMWAHFLALWWHQAHPDKERPMVPG